MSRKYHCTVVAVGLLVAFTPEAALACAVCGLDDLAYIWSFLFMTGVPLAAICVIGGYFYISYRRKYKLSRPSSVSPIIHRREKAN